MGVGKGHGRGVVEPERPVEYLDRCRKWGRQRSTDGMGSFFLAQSPS